MHKIKIKNFGPIKNVELTADKFIFLLGEQASGKSTVAKLIYFCKTIPEEFIQLLFTSDDVKDWNEFKYKFYYLLNEKLESMFNFTDKYGEPYVHYIFSETNNVTIKPDLYSFYNVIFNDTFETKMKIIWDDVKVNLFSAQRNINYGVNYDVLNDNININMKKMKIITIIRRIFNSDEHVVYIPAGRAFLSRQSLSQLIQAEEIKRLNPVNERFNKYDIIDAPTRNYIHEVSHIREWYFNARIKDDVLTSENAGICDSIEKMKSFILKGRFVADRSGDFIQIEDNKSIKISDASSGQQEVVWLLNILYTYAVQNRKCLLLIEEPEAHLHPEAQYMLVKCIAAFCNETGSEVIITTHSPYILTSFNNLIYAGKCGKSTELANDINEVIKKESWIDPNKFSSYMLENGVINDIKNDELAMIDIAELHAVASKQDTEYEQMLAIKKGKSRCI